MGTTAQAQSGRLLLDKGSWPLFQVSLQGELEGRGQLLAVTPHQRPSSAQPAWLPPPESRLTLRTAEARGHRAH